MNQSAWQVSRNQNKPTSLARRLLLHPSLEPLAVLVVLAVAIAVTLINQGVL